MGSSHIIEISRAIGGGEEGTRPPARGFRTEAKLPFAGFCCQIRGGGGYQTGRKRSYGVRKAFQDRLKKTKREPKKKSEGITLS